MTKETVCFKLPTIEEVEFTTEAEREEIPIRGNALVSGNEEEDKEVEEDIIERLDNGDIWAWCSVRVSAKFKGREGTDYLGCCSYKDKADFVKNSGYYEDMKRSAYDDLINSLKELAD
jgi:hypothetical protein